MLRGPGADLSPHHSLLEHQLACSPKHRDTAQSPGRLGFAWGWMGCLVGVLGFLASPPAPSPGSIELSFQPCWLLVLAQVSWRCWGLPAQDSRSLGPSAAGLWAPKAHVRWE